MWLDLKQTVMTGKVLVQLNGRFGKGIVREVERFHPLSGFEFKQNHSAGCEPVGSERKQAAIQIETVFASIQGESWFTTEDGEVA